MPFYHFMWTDELIEYLDQHGISVEDFEYVVCNPDSVEISRSSGRPMAFGCTKDGKEIACVYESDDDFTIIPITAYEVGE